MYEQVEKTKENKSKVIANFVVQKKGQKKHGFVFVDNRADVLAQRNMNQSFDFIDNRPMRIVQRSWTGKAGTLLGTAVAGGLSALALPAILPIAASTAAIAGGIGYLGYKRIFGGPFIGGKTNIDILQQGKGRGRKNKLGVGFINKKHLFSHSVAVIDRTAYDQSLNGEFSSAGLLNTLFRAPQEEEAQASFGKYDGFDMRRGRVVTIDTRKPNADSGRNEVRRKKSSGYLPYRLLSNSCSSNVADVLSASGLTPPKWAKTPFLLHKWMKSMNLLQRIIPKE